MVTGFMFFSFFAHSRGSRKIQEGNAHKTGSTEMGEKLISSPPCMLWAELRKSGILSSTLKPKYVSLSVYVLCGVPGE